MQKNVTPINETETLIVYRRCILISVMMVLLTGQAISQSWQAFTPAFKDTLGIYDCEISNEYTAWFVGFRFGKENTGQVAYTQDGGKNFSVHDVPLQGVPYLPCITSSDEQTAYVIALQDWGNAVTLKTTDGGKQWSNTQTPWDPIVSWPDYIHAFSKDVICQIGDPRNGEYEIYRSENEGAQWSLVDGLNIPDPLSGEFGFNNCGDTYNDHIWFGTNQGRLYHSPDQGKIWEVFNTPLTGIGGISFSDESTGVIAGTYGIADSVTTKLYITKDGGKNWEELFLPVNDIYHFYGVPHFIRESSILVAPVYTNPQLFGSNQTWISFDDGETWTLYSDGEIIGWPEFSNGKTGWAGEWGPVIPGGPTQIYKYIGNELKVRNSKIWSAHDPGHSIPNLGCAAIDVLNENAIWAVHARYSVNDSLYGFFVDSLVRCALSFDGGTTWKNNLIPIGNPAFVANICALDNNTAWVSGIDAAGSGSKVLKTEDAGKTWKHQTTAAWDPAASWVNFVHFWSPAKGITMGDPRDGEFEIYTTGNGGQFWNRIAGDKIPDPLPGEFGYNNDYDVVGNTIWFGTNKGRVFRSANAGASWDAFETDLQDGAFDFGDHGHGIFYYNDFLTFTSKMRISQDGGTTWQDLTTIPENGNFRINTLEFVPGSNVIIMTTTNFSLIRGLYRTWISKDDGLNWLEIDNETNVGWMDFSNPSNGWGGQPQMLNGPNYLFKYSGTPLTGILTAEELDLELICYPNPANEFIQIQSETTGIGDYIIWIHNNQGQLLQKIDGKAENNINYLIEIQHWQPGQYQITLSTTRGSKSISFGKF